MDVYEKAKIAANELPILPPEDTAQIVEQRGLLGGNVLVYRVAWVYNPLTERKDKMVKVTCTACGNTYYLDYSQEFTMCHWNPCTFGFYSPVDKKVIIHDDSCVCPECGEGCKAVHIGSCNVFGGHYVISSSSNVATVHNDGGFLSVLTWRVYRCTDKEGCIKYYAEKNEGVMIIDGMPIRITGHRKNLGGYDCQLPQWQSLKRFSLEIGDIPSNKIMPISADIVNTSSADKSGIKEFVEGNTGSVNLFAYLKLWCKKPNIENLVKGGFAKFVNSLIVECSNYTTSYYYERNTITFDVRKINKYINLEQVRPHLILGVEKDKLLLISKLSVNQFFIYKYVKQTEKHELSEEFFKLKDGTELNKEVEFFSNCFKGIKPHYFKTVNYIAKQNKLCKEKSLINLQYLKDYWGSLYEVYGEYPAELLYPKDLKNAHDRTLLLVKEKEDAKLNKQIKTRAEKLKAMIFEDRELGLMIFPASSHSDLIKEGKILDHCVARYADSVAKGNTAIFFIRKKSDQDIPFFTLEYRNGMVIQNRGRKNCGRTKEVISFEKKWLKFINEGAKVNGK